MSTSSNTDSLAQSTSSNTDSAAQAKETTIGETTFIGPEKSETPEKVMEDPEEQRLRQELKKRGYVLFKPKKPTKDDSEEAKKQRATKKEKLKQERKLFREFQKRSQMVLQQKGCLSSDAGMLADGPAKKRARRTPPSTTFTDPLAQPTLRKAANPRKRNSVALEAPTTPPINEDDEGTDESYSADDDEGPGSLAAPTPRKTRRVHLDDYPPQAQLPQGQPALRRHDAYMFDTGSAASGTEIVTRAI